MSSLVGIQLTKRSVCSSTCVKILARFSEDKGRKAWRLAASFRTRFMLFGEEKSRQERAVDSEKWCRRREKN